MKSPGITSSVPFSAGDDDEEWTEFGEPCSCDCHTPGVTNNVPAAHQQWTGQKKESAFELCFPPVRVSPVALSTKRKLLTENETTLQFWESLCDHSVPPNSVGHNEAILSRLRSSVVCPPSTQSLPTAQPVLDLPADSELFDWQHEEREIDPIPTFVRPGKPESPVDINFDHSQAAFGLSLLGGDDLRQMKSEMSEKFQHLSEVLVKELQERDQLIHSLNVKNTFISALLKVQSIRYHPTDEKLSTAKYLHSVVPFHPPASGNWSTAMLQQLTRILDAIAGNNDTVPDLVSAYIQSEVLKE